MSGAKRLTVGGLAVGNWQLKMVNDVLLECWLLAVGCRSSGYWRSVNRVLLSTPGDPGRFHPAARRTEPTRINRLAW